MSPAGKLRWYIHHSNSVDGAPCQFHDAGLKVYWGSDNIRSYIYTWIKNIQGCNPSGPTYSTSVVEFQVPSETVRAYMYGQTYST